MNTFRDMYAVQITNLKKVGKAPRYVTGFSTRSEAEIKMRTFQSEATYSYRVVYIREYPEDHYDPGAHRQVHSVIEIPEFYTDRVK